LQMARSWYGQEDHELTDRLVRELPGILLWAMEGWNRLQERGRFIQPASSREIIREMEDLTSPVGAFVRERCELGNDFSIRMADLYEAYQKWCEDNGRKPTSQQVFGRDLRAAQPDIGDSQPRARGARVRVYKGIRLIPDSPFD
jgi:putative DNA primase/helicase